NGLPGFDDDGGAGRIDIDRDVATAAVQTEAHPLPSGREPRRDANVGSRVPHSTEPVHQTCPYSADVGEVGAVDRVAVGVGDVEEQRLAEVVHRQVAVTDLRGHDRLHARGQRRIAGADRVVVVEVAPYDVGREIVGT